MLIVGSDCSGIDLQDCQDYSIQMNPLEVQLTLTLTLALALALTQTLTLTLTLQWPQNAGGMILSSVSMSLSELADKASHKKGKKR